MPQRLPQAGDVSGQGVAYAGSLIVGKRNGAMLTFTASRSQGMNPRGEGDKPSFPQSGKRDDASAQIGPQIVMRLENLPNVPGCAADLERDGRPAPKTPP